MFKPKPKITIEFGENDLAYSDYTNEQLLNIESLHGYEFKNSLLIPKELINTC